MDLTLDQRLRNVYQISYRFSLWTLKYTIDGSTIGVPEDKNGCEMLERAELQKKKKGAVPQSVSLFGNDVSALPHSNLPPSPPEAPEKIFLVPKQRRN
jgi:hypothetical protein